MAKKTAKNPRGRPATGVTPKRYFRMSNDEFALVRNAAEETGKSNSEYIRETLLADARRILKK